MNGKIENHVYLVCKQSFPQHHLVPLGAIRSVIMEEIIKDYPDCSKQDFICKADLTKYRMQYVQTLLQSEQGSFKP